MRDKRHSRRWGGRRKGSGRPRGYTKTGGRVRGRIPKSLIADLSGMKYKDLQQCYIHLHHFHKGQALHIQRRAFEQVVREKFDEEWEMEIETPRERRRVAQQLISLCERLDGKPKQMSVYR